MMNLFLRITKRLAVSDDPVQIQAQELMLNGMIEGLMVDYFNFRDIVWKGEKEAVSYWASQDPEYLDLFMQCLREVDAGLKLQAFEELAAIVATPVGGIWEEGHTALSVQPGPGDESGISAATERALDFWEELLEG